MTCVPCGKRHSCSHSYESETNASTDFTRASCVGPPTPCPRPPCPMGPDRPRPPCSSVLQRKRLLPQCPLSTRLPVALSLEFSQEFTEHLECVGAAWGPAHRHPPPRPSQQLSRGRVPFYRREKRGPEPEEELNPNIPVFLNRGQRAGLHWGQTNREPPIRLLFLLSSWRENNFAQDSHTSCSAWHGA